MWHNIITILKYINILIRFIKDSDLTFKRKLFQSLNIFKFKRIHTRLNQYKIFNTFRNLTLFFM